jgi:hypothetical protein
MLFELLPKTGPGTTVGNTRQEVYFMILLRSTNGNRKLGLSFEQKEKVCLFLCRWPSLNSSQLQCTGPACHGIYESGIEIKVNNGQI